MRIFTIDKKRGNLKRRRKKGLDSKQIAIILFLISFFVRVLFINDGLFHHDSIQLARATEETLKDFDLKPAVHGRYGLVLINSIFYFIPHYFFGIESSEFTITLVTILLSSLAVSFIYLFCFELSKSRFISLSSSLLFSFSPVFLSITTYAKSHGPAIFFAAVSGYLLVRYIKSNSVRFLFFSSLAFCYGLFVRFDNILFVIPFSILFFFQDRFLSGWSKDSKKIELKKIIFFMIPFILLFLASLRYGDFFWVSSSESIPFNDVSRIFKLIYISVIATYHSITFLISWFVIASIVFIFLKGKNIIRIFKNVKEKNIFNSQKSLPEDSKKRDNDYEINDYKIKNPKDYNSKKERNLMLFGLIWFFSIFLPLGITNVATPRHYAVSFFGLLFIAGMGLNEIYKRKKIFGILVLIIFLLVSFLKIYPVIDYRHEYSGPKEFALWIDKNTENDSFIIIDDDSVFINYYSNRSILDYPKTKNSSRIYEFILRVYNILENNRTVYVTSRTFGLDKKNSPAYTMDYNFKIIKVGEVITEDYHHSELVTHKRKRVIYRIEKKINPDHEQFKVWRVE